MLFHKVQDVIGPVGPACLDSVMIIIVTSCLESGCRVRALPADQDVR
jgi:hypothetical protein